MTETTEATGRDSLGGTTSPLLGPIRIGIGLLQGLGLYWLQSSADNDVKVWPATEPLLFGPLLLVVAFLPLVLLAGVGRLRPVTLAIWTAVAGVALALLGLHDIARQSADTLRNPPFLSAPVILFSAAALIILINTAYQDGRPDNLPPLVLRFAVRVAAVLLTPLVVLAVLGLSLRIGQYGLTPDRIIAAACALVGIAYAAGYGWAALSPFWRKGDWMRPLERTNIWTALLTVGVILLLFSPALDPARLSVMDQVARLERGAVTPDKFDFRFLRFDSGKAGQAALERLARSRDAAIASKAKAAQRFDIRYDGPGPEEEQPVPPMEVWPAGTVLPADFLANAGRRQSLQFCRDVGDCVATLRDLNGDGTAEAVVTTQAFVIVFERTQAEGWRLSAEYLVRPPCPGKEDPDPREALKSGRILGAPSRWPALTVGDSEPITPDVQPACGGRNDIIGSENHGRLRPASDE